MKVFHSLLLIILLSFSLSAFAEKVNINTASAEQLAAAISGIGESRAKAIVEYRNTHGKFQSIEALQDVAGIGEKTIEKNRDKLSL